MGLCAKVVPQFGKLTDPQLFRQLVAQGSFEFPPLPQAWLTFDTAVNEPVEVAQSIATEWRALSD